MDIESDPALANVGVALALDANQRALSEALQQRSHSLQAMYIGGLWVKTQTHNPDALALAAHSFRELMEKLPAILDVALKAMNEGTNGKVRDLIDDWTSASSNSSCMASDRSWWGDIDAPLRGFLAKVESFIEWFDTFHPRRRAEVHATLRALEPSMMGLPPSIEELNVDRWIKTRDFFVGTAHHRLEPSADEFNRWQFALEQQILGALRPVIFANLDAIDNLIAEGEENA